MDLMEEPEWLEKNVFGEMRVWQVMFLCLAGVTTLIVMVCCCFRFRIPRTKQQIEADYQRRKITTKFRQQLEAIEDTKIDTMSLHDAVELLYEKTKVMDQKPSPPSSIGSPPAPPVQSASDAALQPETETQTKPQSSSFVKFASKVATLTKLGINKPPATTPEETN